MEKAVNSRCRDLNSLVDGTPVLSGGMISNFRRRLNKKGEDWITFKISDFSGSVDCVIFARQFKKVTFKVFDDQVVFISGTKKLQSFNGEPQIIVEDMELIDYLHESVRWKLTVSLILDERNSKPEQLQHLKSILKSHAGDQELQVIYRCQGYNVKVALPKDLRVTPHLLLLKDLDSIFGEQSINIRLQPPVNNRWG